MPIEVAPIASPNPNQRFMAAVMANARRPEPLADSLEEPSFKQAMVDSFTRDSLVGSFLTDFVPYHLGQKDLPAEIDPAFDPYKQYGNPEWLNANPHMLDAFLDGDVADIPNQQRFDWFAARMKQDYDIRQRLAAAGTTRNILATIPGQIIDGMVGGLALRGLGLAGKAAQAGEWLKAGGTAAKFGKSAMLGASLNLAQEEALRALNPSRHVDEGQAALWAVGLGAAFGSGAHFIASGKTKLGKWMDPIRAKILSQQIASELSDPKFHGLDDVAAADADMLGAEIRKVESANPKMLASENRKRVIAEMTSAFSAEQANTIAPVMDAYARSWSKSTGKPVDEFYSGLRVEKGGTPGDGALFSTVAWHGSPYKFDKFDIGMIGEGEGAQAFGHGLYFASSKDVAEYYRNNLSAGEPPSFTNGSVTMSYEESLAEYFKPGNIVPSYGGYDRVLEFTPSSPETGGWRVKVQSVDRSLNPVPGERPRIHYTNPESRDLRAFMEKAGFKEAPKGRLYKVELAPNENQYLDWNKPLSEQSPEVIAAIEKMGGGDQFGGYHPGDTGMSVYKHLSEQQGPEAASKALKEAGVPGIKYLDGASRSKGVGNYNYVIFDDANVTIKEMFQKGASGNAQGSFELAANGQRVIRALTNPDASTLPHEVAHDFLEHLPVIDGKLAEDAATALGAKNFASLKTSHKERFARGFEAYLRSGKAPSEQLKTVFQKFKEWLVEIYRSIKGSPLERKLNPKLKSVFDDMLTRGDTSTPPGLSVGASTPAGTRLREGEIKRFTVLRTPITKQLMKEVEAHYKGGVEWNEHPQQWAYDAKKALEELDAEAKKYAPADLGPVQNAVVKTLGAVTPARKLYDPNLNPSAFSRLVSRVLFDFTLPTQESFDNPLTNVVNTPAEGLRMVYNGWAAESRLAYDEAFREAWQGRATARLSDGSDVTIGRGSKHEFSRAVQERIFAMHEEGRGQRAPSVVHPAIQKAADTLNEYYRKIGFEGKASGYLNYTTNPALPHFTQQWLTDVVERNKSDFIARLKTQWEKNRRIDYDTGTPIDPETWTTDNKVVNPEKISKGANAGGLTKADREAINAYAINNEMSVNEVTLANLRDEFGQDLLDRYEQELQIYYQKAAESTYDSLTHIDNGHGVLDAMDSIPADVREGRILKIDPTQFADYLERDAVRLLESYDHMVSGRISTRMAIKRDVKNIDKWYKPLMGRSIAADDYNPQMLIEAINEDFKAKIADERITTDLKDRYQHARDMLIGEKNGLLTSKLAELERRESGRPVGWKLFAERNIIRMPFLAQMGKVTIAAFNDLAGAAFVKRLAPEQVGTVRSILKPFVGAPRRDIQGAYVAVVDAIRGLRGDDLVDFSPNIERARFGHGIGGTVMSAVDTATGWMQKKLVQATGINRWSQGMRRFMAGGIMQDIIVGAKKMHQASILVGRGMKQEDAFAKVGLDIADARRLNRLGINSERATRLLEKIDQHGVDYEGNRVDNTHDGFISPEMNKWWAEDRDLYYTLNNAVNSETLNLVVEPKILSRPLMNNTLLGKLFNQFQGFAMAWGTQLAPLAMQRGGHEIAMYAGLMVGLGAIADALRNELTGRRTIGDTIDMWQKNPAGMVYAAVDRSGMTGWLSRPLGLLEQTPFGIAKNLKNTGLSTQYGRQGPLIDQLGPVFGWSNKVYSGVMAGMYEGGWDRKAKMMLWRATPFNNLWAVEGFNRVSEHMGFGTPLGPSNNYQGAGR